MNVNKEYPIDYGNLGYDSLENLIASSAALCTKLSDPKERGNGDAMRIVSLKSVNYAIVELLAYKQEQLECNLNGILPSRKTFTQFSAKFPGITFLLKSYARKNSVLYNHINFPYWGSQLYLAECLANQINSDMRLTSTEIDLLCKGDAKTWQHLHEWYGLRSNDLKKVLDTICNAKCATRQSCLVRECQSCDPFMG